MRGRWKKAAICADGDILDLEEAQSPPMPRPKRADQDRGGGGEGIWQARNSDPHDSLDTPWWSDDVAMAGRAKPDGILVPKISSVDDLGRSVRS